MDFWKVYQNERASGDFGQQRLSLGLRDRIHASLSSVESYSTNIEVNQAVSASYGESTRYVLAKDLTYDLLLSLYDVNSSSALLLRASSPLGKESLAEIRKRLGRLRRPNLEMRAIGLQNGDKTMLESIDKIHALANSALLEADLFGSSTRHLAFDLKLGMQLDLLPLNRAYLPGDLANGLSIEGFGRLRSEIKFV
jgi:hypothetical protein